MVEAAATSGAESRASTGSQTSGGSGDQRTMGALLCLFAAVAWGTTGTAATFAPGVGPLAIGAAAMGIGGLLQALTAWRHIMSHRAILRAQTTAWAIGAVAVAIYPLAFYASMHFAGVTVGTVVSIGSAPLVSALIENRMDRRPLSLHWAVGAALGLAGIVLLSLTEGDETLTGNVPLGAALGLLAGGTYAGYSWTAQRLMRRGVPPRAAMGATFGAGGLLLLPVLLVTGAGFLESAGNMAVGLYMAVVPMFLGYLAFGGGLARVEASTATTLTLFEPAVAAVLAATVVGESLPPAAWFGVGLILLCLVWTTLPAPRRPLLR